jgi:hypothetical protein
MGVLNDKPVVAVVVDCFDHKDLVVVVGGVEGDIEDSCHHIEIH